LTDLPACSVVEAPHYLQKTSQTNSTRSL
jgi:hypothetical protein